MGHIGKSCWVGPGEDQEDSAALQGSGLLVLELGRKVRQTRVCQVCRMEGHSLCWDQQRERGTNDNEVHNGQTGSEIVLTSGAEEMLEARL